MKSKNTSGLQLIILFVVLGLGVNLCTSNREDANRHTPSYLIDTTSVFKDTALNNKSPVTSKKINKNKRKKNKSTIESVPANSYLTPIQTTTKRKRSYSSSSSSKGCSSQQCNGSTKKGGRCRNMTKSCNGYCWRHGG